jgi:molecular chaperone Hsp33
MLKFEGVFTLQTKGDGPVGMAVVDMTTDGELRGYADFDASRLVSAGGASTGKAAAARDLLGEGYIAFTVDQGPHSERYQGIVDLRGETLAECLQHYFRQSEQLKTAVKLSAGQYDGAWRAGGLLLHLPDYDLLYRLFHDERVRVYNPRPLTTGCRCSRARIERILRSLPRKEVVEMKVEGEIIMTCQFCNEEYRFDEAALERVYAP